MYRVDHLSDVKRGGVCTYYRAKLPLKALSTSFLQEWINFEVSIGNKICRFIHLYRTPSQSQDEFQDFLTNLEMNRDDSFNSNPFLTTLIGDFNVKSKNWSEGDRSTIKGSNIEFLTSQFELSQIIKEPTQILLYWPYFYNSTKYGIRIWSSSLTTPKLSPSNNICQI